MLIWELVAGHRYHSSRYRCGNWSQTGCYYWEIKSNTSLYWLNVVQINWKLIGKHSTTTSDRLLYRNATTHRLPNVDFPYLTCLKVPSLIKKKPSGLYSKDCEKSKIWVQKIWSQKKVSSKSRFLSSLTKIIFLIQIFFLEKNLKNTIVKVSSLSMPGIYRFPQLPISAFRRDHTSRRRLSDTGQSRERFLLHDGIVVSTLWGRSGGAL